MKIKSVSSLGASGVGDVSARGKRSEGVGAASSSQQTGSKTGTASNPPAEQSSQAAVVVRTTTRRTSQPQSGPSLIQTAKAALTGTATARLIKRVFGFKIGKLGVRYTSQDLEIDREEMARKSAEQEKKRQASAFAGELDVAENREALADGDVEIPAEDAVQTVPTGPMSWLKKLAFALYSRNAKETPDEKQEHKLIAVA